MTRPAAKLKLPIPVISGSQDTFYVARSRGWGVSVSRHLWTLTQRWHAQNFTRQKLRSQLRIYSMTRFYPCLRAHNMGIIRMLTDRGTEYCGKVETHDYESFYLRVSGIEHTKTKARHPQTNGICERFHKTILHEFYRVAFRKKIYKSLEELQTDLDQWLNHYNNERTHQGKMCCGRTPMQTFLDGKKNLGGKGRTVEFI